jgi:hypothetical protein
VQSGVVAAPREQATIAMQGRVRNNNTAVAIAHGSTAA